MAFPDGVQTVTLTAGTSGYRTLDGDPYQGTIRLTPSVPRVVSAEHGVIALGAENITIGASGEFSTTVLATDADGFSPSGWTYRVDEEFANAPGAAYNISLPASAATATLSALTRIESTTGTVSSPAVLSVNGETGVVTLDATDVGATPTNRQVTAGTGLTGGGTLAADRTLAVAFGTSGTTACAGNDSRLSDARTPNAHAASHAAAAGDPVTLTQAQITGLTAALAALAPLAGATFTGVVTINGTDFVILGTNKGFRFRPTGSALDLEAAGADFLISVWSGATVGAGTQRSYFRLSADAQNVQLAGKFESVAALYGGAVHTLDPATGVASLGGKNGLIAVRLAGFKNSAGAPAAGTWAAGDVVLDSAGAWHLCTASGEPGAWT